MKLEFSTNAFVRAHGRAPRGRGSWAFCPAARYNDSNYLDSTFFVSGSYADAKKQAREHFASMSEVSCVVVCS